MKEQQTIKKEEIGSVRISNFLEAYLKRTKQILRIKAFVKRLKDMGIANINHEEKDISGIFGKYILIIFTKIAFGGVPTSVVIPPMDAE